MSSALSIAALAALCAGWALFQRWVVRNGGAPREDALDRGCGGCGSTCDIDPGRPAAPRRR